MLNIGQRIDRYVVEGKLGEGGMAAVYRVRHETLRTAHALKVLVTPDPKVRERLVREGRLQARLSHENVVQVTDVLTVGDQPGLLMEFVEGPTLEQWLMRYRPTLSEAETVFRALCTGVGFAHHKGLIHRDLKPSNVLLSVVDDRIVPKVADFGLARKLDSQSTRSTRAGSPLGTPGYMPPEQIRDASSVDRRADIWSLGCILYRMVCGVPAFDGDDIIELFAQVAAADYVPSRRLRPDLPERIHAAIERTIRVPLHERVADCALLVDFLDGRRELSLAYQPRALLPEPPGPRALSNCPEALEVARDIVAETLLGLPKLERDSDPGRPVSIDPVVPSKAVLGPAPALSPPPPKPKKPQNRYAGRALDQPGALAPPVGVRRITVDEDASAPSGTRWWMLVLLVLLSGGSTAILLLGGGGLWFWFESTREPEVGGTPPLEPLVPAPAPEPVPVAKRPPKPRPAPVEPVAVEPVPTASTGRVSYSGADELWLVGPSGEVRDLSKVPPGRYKVMAVFPAVGAVSAHGGVTVQAGQNLVLTCVADFAQCKAQ